MQQSLLAIVWDNTMWMSWNAMLALLPFILAIVLFKPRRQVGVLWFIGFLFFVILLPNAPYVFTDVIHIPEDWRVVSSRTSLLVLTWQYVFFFSFGYVLFCESYRRFEHFTLNKIPHFHANKTTFQLLVFFVISIGVFLGRFPRLNSWDLLINPGRVIFLLDNLIQPFSLTFILFYTLLLAFSYGLYELVYTNLHKIKAYAVFKKKPSAKRK